MRDPSGKSRPQGDDAGWFVPPQIGALTSASALFSEFKFVPHSSRVSVSECGGFVTCSWSKSCAGTWKVPQVSTPYPHGVRSIGPYSSAARKMGRAAKLLRRQTKHLSARNT